MAEMFALLETPKYRLFRDRSIHCRSFILRLDELCDEINVSALSCQKIDCLLCFCNQVLCLMRAPASICRSFRQRDASLVNVSIHCFFFDLFKILVLCYNLCQNYAFVWIAIKFVMFFLLYDYVLKCACLLKMYISLVCITTINNMSRKVQYVLLFYWR